MTLRSEEREALDALTEWLRERFGPRLRDARLFGSRARGEGHEGSDLDVLVLVEALTPAERREIGQHTGDLLTRFDVIVATLAMDTAHWAELHELERRLPREIARDGVDLLER